MTKPRLFIGSSAENKHLAETIQANLSRETSPFIWTQGVFEPSQYPLESLADALKIADFAILVCAPDDLTIMRKEQKATVRDNVIFELGLFMGRLGRERTFLVSPRGVELHLPTDLSGLYPETYDPSDLENPEAALGPACSKLRRVILRDGVLPRREEEEAANVAPAAEKPDSTTPSDYHDPAAHWTLETYEIALMLACGRRDGSQFDRIDAAFRQSPLVNDTETAALWDATREVRKIPLGRRVDLGLIRKHSEAFPNNLDILRLLGDALSHYGEDAAADAYIAVVERSEDIGAAARTTSKALSAVKQKEKTQLAARLKNSLLEKAADSVEQQIDQLRGLEDIALAMGLKRLRLALAETALSLSPDRSWSRYHLAGQYSDDGQNELAMLHYEHVPPVDRGDGGWNNLGVSYARLSMGGKATVAYQEASRAGGLVSEGNLVHKLISAGFYAEAKEKLNAALRMENRDDSLLGAVTALQTAEDTEKARHETATETAKMFRAVHISIGKAASAKNCPALSGEWATERCVLRLAELKDGVVEGEGTIVKDATESTLGLFGMALQKRTRTTPVSVRLIRIGNALEGELIERRTEGLVGLLGSYESEVKLLLRITEDGQFIQGIEKGYQTKPVQWVRERGNLIEHAPEAK